MNLIRNLGLNLIVGVLYLLLHSCGNDNKVKVTGKLTHATNATIKLYELKQDNAELIDSIQLSEQTTDFNFLIDVDKPTFYMLRFFDNEKIYLILNTGEEISIEINNGGGYLSYYVKGSEDCRLLCDLAFEQQKTKDKISELSYKFNQALEKDTLPNKLEFDSVYNEILENHKQYSKNLINSNLGSLANIFVLYQDFGINKSLPLFQMHTNIDLFNKVDSVLTLKYSTTDAVIALNQDLSFVKEQIKYNKSPGVLVNKGMPLPSLQTVSISGDSIISVNYKGDLLLVCFFAVWSNISLKSIELAKELELQYSNKGFKTVFISLDKDEKRLKDFLQSENISQPVICDYKYWDSPYVRTYNVQALPYYIIVNKNGRIEATSNRPDEMKLLIDALF